MTDIYVRCNIAGYTQTEQWDLTATHTVHTMEYNSNNNKSRKKKNIEMSKRQLELSKHTAYDAHTHIHTQQIEI